MTTADILVSSFVLALGLAWCVWLARASERWGRRVFRVSQRRRRREGFAERRTSLHWLDAIGLAVVVAIVVAESCREPERVRTVCHCGGETFSSVQECDAACPGWSVSQ